MRRGFAIATVLLASLPALAAAQTADLPRATTALVVAYADGKARYDLVSEKPAWFWTPTFPRVESWSPPPGTLPITALQVRRQRVGEEVRVTVSLLLGRAHEEEKLVKAIVLSSASRVVVRELLTYGVQPIELWLAEAAPMTPFLPTVVSVTPQVEIAAVDLLSAPYPGYRITLRNLSPRSIAAVHMQAYRGETKAMSSVPRGPDGHPAMTPGESFSFPINLTTGAAIGSGGWSPEPLDVIEIDTVVWEDGTTVGDALYARMAPAIASDAATRVQLTRAVQVLSAAAQSNGQAGEMVEQIRRGLQALPEEDAALLPAAQVSLRGMRAAALADLARFTQDRSVAHDAEGTRRWIATTQHRYESWIRRLSPG